MNRSANTLRQLLVTFTLALSCMLSMVSSHAQHDVRGINGPDFELYAFPFNMNLPDGSSVYMWGFGDMKGGTDATHSEGNGYNLPQYPGPTLIVNQGELVTIEVSNFGVPQPISLVVGGHNAIASAGALPTNTLFGPGAVTGGGKVIYQFTAGAPGTYQYHSMNTPNPGLHVEMGLTGVLIVRPTTYNVATNRVAYTETNTDYDQEYLYILTEIDPNIHFEMERGHYNHFTNSDRLAKVWFINGRVFPDVFQGDYNTIFPHQPYEAVAKAHPGDNVLVREINLGLDSHPFHHHGENLRFIARDGRVMSSNGADADLGRSDNTINMAPKQAVDMIWTWTGKDLNWDIYGPINADCTDSDNDMEDDMLGEPIACHDASCNDGDVDGFDDDNHEYCADHGKDIPVNLPGAQELSLGGWWSGSPFLGDTGGLPPGEGGLNPFGGYFLVWHSHAEKELTTFDIFPGGSLSAIVVLPPYLQIN